MGDEQRRQTPIILTIEHSQTKNLGNYSSVRTSLTIQGEFDELVNNKHIIKLAWPVATNVSKVCKKVNDGDIPPKDLDEAIVKVEELSKGKPVEKKEEKKSAKKEETAEPKEKAPKETLKKIEEDDI